MAFFEWKKEYETGVKGVDDDHRFLVSLIDEMSVALSQGVAQDLLHKTVYKLADYARFHFKREENYMQMIDYSEQFKHEIEHRAITKKVEEFVAKLDSGEDNLTHEVLVFLRDWLINHIQKTDKQLGIELVKHGLKDE